MPKNRKSLGNMVLSDSAFLQRQGRSTELCDFIPIPGESPLSLHQNGHYNSFADDANLAVVVKYLSSLDSDYAISSAVHFAIDENLKKDKTMSAYDLPSRYKETVANTVLSAESYGNLKELKSRVHYVVASIRTMTNFPSEFAAFDHSKNEFVKLNKVNKNSISELNKLLQIAKENKQLLIMPFDSMALSSSHMCTMVIEPKPKNTVTVHVFDPNGEVPTKEPAFPFMKNYRKAVESSILLLFSFQTIFEGTAVNFHSIPNFNIPGARPRNGKSSLPVDKIFLAYQLDRKIYDFVYTNEGEGICVIVSLFVMVMTICFGKRVLKTDFWLQAFRNMSGSPLKSNAVINGLDRNQLIHGGKEALHQVYMRTIYMRSLAWSLYRLALPSKKYNDMGGKSLLLFFHASGTVSKA